jgi:anti-sigma B factor antagonist
MALLQVKALPEVMVATMTASHLDESNADDVGEELSALVGPLGERELRLDLTGVNTVTSVGLGKMLSLYRKVLLGGGRLSLWNVRPEVYELFALTHLTDFLEVHAQSDGPAQD